MRTPWLHVQSDNRLSGRLGLAGLLGGVLGKALLSDLGSLCVLLLVGRTEKVDLIIILLSSLLRGLGGVDGELRRLGSVCSVLLRWVTGEGGEFRLERGDVLVPAVCVGVLLGGRLRLDGLEGLDVGLGRSVALRQVSLLLRYVKLKLYQDIKQAKGSELRQALWFCNRAAGS